MGFAIVDFETTGLAPEIGDRVVEIGIVLVDPEGRHEHEWTTLINPRRDVGATHIHRLKAADLLDAPEFGEVADQVLALISGRAVVSHNATFDMRFMRAELTRAGYSLRDRPPAICSMKWSGKFIGSAKLKHACEALGIALRDEHSALGDARAAAQLLVHIMHFARETEEWLDDASRSRTFVWPRSAGRPPARCIVRGQRSAGPSAWLDNVLSAAWIPGVPEDEASYLLVLERALLDRQISLSEGKLLEETARASRLSVSTVGHLHRQYLKQVAEEALEDGTVTDAERAELQMVAHAIGLTDDDIVEALTWAAEQQSQGRSEKAFRLEAGDRIVFTGEISRPRDEWVAEVVAAGLASGGVTKSTRLLVAADPDSLSGKAAKAREYCIPIVNEATFARLFAAYKSNR